MLDRNRRLQNPLSSSWINVDYFNHFKGVQCDWGHKNYTSVQGVHFKSLWVESKWRLALWKIYWFGFRFRLTGWH
jgi:hypothetical protein